MGCTYIISSNVSAVSICPRDIIVLFLDRDFISGMKLFWACKTFIADDDHLAAREQKKQCFSTSSLVTIYAERARFLSDYQSRTAPGAAYLVQKFCVYDIEYT